MNPKKRVETVKLKELQTNLFVRKALDQDHILYLAELMENGVKMRDRILVGRLDGQSLVIDGRHRIEAYELNGVTETEADIVEVTDEVELITLAYKANDPQGSLRPSAADTEHTVMLLLERGVPKKHIGKLLGLPTGMARRYVSDMQSKAARAKLMRAAGAVTDGGLTVAKAAEQHDMDPDKLREVLSGNRRRRKQGIAEIQRGLTTLYKSLGSRNAALLRSFLDKHEDGDVTGRQVRDVFTHIEQLQKRAARAVADWKQRFAAGNGKPAA